MGKAKDCALAFRILEGIEMLVVPSGFSIGHEGRLASVELAIDSPSLEVLKLSMLEDIVLSGSRIC